VRPLYFQSKKKVDNFMAKADYFANGHVTWNKLVSLLHAKKQDALASWPRGEGKINANDQVTEREELDFFLSAEQRWDRARPKRSGSSIQKRCG